MKTLGNHTPTFALPNFLASLAVMMTIACIFCAQAFAQTSTAGGTTISNTASATYSDGTGNNFSTVSNTVTVTVANVSGLIITPDGGTRPSVVGGQTAAFTFTVSNTANFSDQVRFLANGASYTVSGPATVAQAFIDLNANGTFESGTDIDIKNNATAVTSPSLAPNTSMTVIVTATANNTAVSGDTIAVRLGDATNDNDPANNSANEVATVSTSSNGSREAVGNISAAVENDAQLRLTLTAPTGPLALGSNISYGWSLTNSGARQATAITLANAPAGANSGVFIIAPVPVGTQLASGQTFPAGTLFTTSALSVDPLNAIWTTTLPNSGVTRVAYNAGNSLAVGATTTANMAVTITTNNATAPIYEIGDAFAKNEMGATISDQSGDTVANAGDGNANFSEDNLAGNQGPQFNGVQQETTLQAVGAVLVGPSGQPAATGPSSNNDDYTNKSVKGDLITGIAPGGVTTLGGRPEDAVVFTNTVQNTGNANDTFSLTVPSVPANFKVEISIDNGASYTTVVPGSGTVSLLINFGRSADVLVRVTPPAGLQVLQGFPVVLRATSTIPTAGGAPAPYNETINRVYTGFLRLDKANPVVTNGTGLGGPNDPVPGAVIEYVINYSNISSTGGSNNSQLTASNIVITEDGNAAPNNWGTTTDQVVGSASDSRGGTITGDTAGQTKLTDSIPSLGPGQSGTFRFKRKIK